MKKIYDFWASIPSDKLAHFFSSSVLLTICLLFFNDWISMGIVVFSALFKEVVYDDFLNKGNPDVKDFLFSILPCGLYALNIFI